MDFLGGFSHNVLNDVPRVTNVFVFPMMFPKFPMCFHPYHTFIPYDLFKVLPFYTGVPKVEALHLQIETFILGEFQIYFFWVWTN